MKNIDWKEVWDVAKDRGNLEGGEKWALYILLGFVVFFWAITL